MSFPFGKYPDGTLPRRRFLSFQEKNSNVNAEKVVPMTRHIP
jgi:hypothetical protein